jgi:FKBP-type peptidyl-prolyl cis-trans isomerase SlyD
MNTISCPLKSEIMETIKKDTLVSISIRIETQQGMFLDESDELIYLHGSYGQIFQKLEDSLMSKGVGETFDIFLTAKEAFGEYQDALVAIEPLATLPEEISLGMELDDQEEDAIWIVESIDGDYATLNANHEFAGVPIRVFGSILHLEHLSQQGVLDILSVQEEDH